MAWVRFAEGTKEARPVISSPPHVITAGGHGGRMRLGLNLGYWGSTPADSVGLAQEAERLGYHSVWTAEALRLGRRHHPHLAGRQDRAHPRGHVRHADDRARPGHDRGHPGPAHRRARAAGPGRLRAAGGGRLARRALRQAAGAHARVRGDCARRPPARETPGASRRGTTSASALAGDRWWWGRR